MRMHQLRSYVYGDSTNLFRAMFVLNDRTPNLPTYVEIPSPHIYGFAQLSRSATELEPKPSPSLSSPRLATPRPSSATCVAVESLCPGSANRKEASFVTPDSYPSQPSPRARSRFTRTIMSVGYAA